MPQRDLYLPGRRNSDEEVGYEVAGLPEPIMPEPIDPELLGLPTVVEPQRPPRDLDLNSDGIASREKMGSQEILRFDHPAHDIEPYEPSPEEQRYRELLQEPLPERPDVPLWRKILGGVAEFYPGTRQYADIARGTRGYHRERQQRAEDLELARRAAEEARTQAGEEFERTKAGQPLYYGVQTDPYGRPITGVSRPERPSQPLGMDEVKAQAVIRQVAGGADPVAAIGNVLSAGKTQNVQVRQGARGELIAYDPNTGTTHEIAPGDQFYDQLQQAKIERERAGTAGAYARAEESRARIPMHEARTRKYEAGAAGEGEPGGLTTGQQATHRRSAEKRVYDILRDFEGVVFDEEGNLDPDAYNANVGDYIQRLQNLEQQYRTVDPGFRLPPETYQPLQNPEELMKQPNWWERFQRGFRDVLGMRTPEAPVTPRTPPTFPRTQSGYPSVVQPQAPQAPQLPQPVGGELPTGLSEDMVAEYVRQYDVSRDEAIQELSAALEGR